MIHQSKFVEMIKVLDECLIVMKRETYHSDKETLPEVQTLVLALEDHKSELNLILMLDMDGKLNPAKIAINSKPVIGVDELIAGIADDAMSDAESTVQNVKTFLRRKI